jgi:hypothetical protein
MSTILNRWIHAVHRLKSAEAGCPAARVALHDLELIDEEWRLAVG